jgi:glyoxylase-like metal-dependent hydrolase (beta-lactamase superfamily II)/rhodanese-related sulfurtransferase
VVDEPVSVLVDEGLGNTSYLVDLGDGRALAVDPSRDLRALWQAAEAKRLTVAFAADTHLHADFLTGACQLATAANATILASAGGARRYPHRGLRDADEVDLGRLRLRTILTPGHTDEHVAFVLLDGGQPIGVFTGGSLIVGAAARTDLLGPERVDELARAQFASLRRLMELPDDVLVWPTHGAGSFCSAPAGAERTSTIGRERATNPLLQLADEDAFVAALVASSGSYPPYFLRLGEINRGGPAVLPKEPALDSLDVDEVASLAEAGTPIVDIRPIAAYAEAHIPGSISIELRDAFATWLGWLVPFGARPVIVRDPVQEVPEIVGQAAKVGYSLRGELSGGVAAWTATGRTTASTVLAEAGLLRERRAVDIRQRAEYVDGHAPAAVNIELGDIPARLDALPDQPYVVMCGHGERAMSAASLIERAGLPAPAVLLGGPAQWSAAQQCHLERGP